MNQKRFDIILPRKCYESLSETFMSFFEIFQVAMKKLVLSFLSLKVRLETNWFNHSLLTAPKVVKV